MVGTVLPIYKLSNNIGEGFEFNLGIGGKLNDISLCTKQR